MEFFLFILFLVFISLIASAFEKIFNFHKFLKGNDLYKDIVGFFIAAIISLLVFSGDGFLIVVGVVGVGYFISYIVRFIKFISFYIELFLLKKKGINTHIKYDVAFSFSGEDRKIVKKLARYLSKRGYSVFYDDYEKSNLWGKDLYTYLSDIYRNKARFCVVIVSDDYKNKLWTNHELRSAQSRSLNENYEYILPIKVDNTQLPGLLDTMAYLDLRKDSVASVALLLEKKIENINSMEKLGANKVSYNMLSNLENAYAPENKNIDIKEIKSMVFKIRSFGILFYIMFLLACFVSLFIIISLMYEDFSKYIGSTSVSLIIIISVILGIRYIFNNWLNKKIRTLDLTQDDLTHLKNALLEEKIKSNYIKKRANYIIEKIQEHGY